MNKKFDKFKYQLVDSTHKGYQEVLVTFEYKKKACHYHSFIQEKPSMKEKQYINEAKKEISEMIKNGELAKRAKRYLNYKLGSTDKLVVVTKANGKPTKIRSKKRACWPFLLLSLVGIILLGLGIVSILRSYNLLGFWPIESSDELSITIHFYAGIAMGALGLVLFGVSTPFFIKNLEY